MELLLSQTEMELNHKIEELLLSVGGRMRMRGFGFSVDAVKDIAAYKYRQGQYHKVYDSIARRYCVTVSSVESAIRNFMNALYRDCNGDHVNKIVGIWFFNKKDPPTGLEFLTIVAERISKEYIFLENDWYRVKDIL